MSEYRRARDILFNKLLFSARDIGTLNVIIMKDNLNTEDYGGLWLIDERNAELLCGVNLALLD